MEKKPEVEDITTCVSSKIPDINRAEVIKHSKVEEEIVLSLWYGGVEIFEAHTYNPTHLQQTTLGYSLMRETLVDGLIEKLRSGKDEF